LNLTKVLKLDANAENICKDDLPNVSFHLSLSLSYFIFFCLIKIKECDNVDDTDGHLVSCLIENIEEVKNERCKNFLTNVAALMFTDYRLISNFQEKCSDNIISLKCGRFDTTDNAPTDQGKFF
jgi:hypothetical protein